MEVRGSVAVVTGGASGLGRATAEELSGHGARVVIIDRNEEQGRAIASGLGADFYRADVTDDKAMEQAIQFAKGLGPLRVAVACAGIGIAERLVARSGEPHSFETFSRVISVNLLGTFNLMRLAGAAMAQASPLEDGQRGIIVATASIAAYEGQIGQIAYSASKGGIVGMVLPAARDLSSVGIRVMAIAPGIMDTPLLGTLPAAVREALGQSVPFPKRLGIPEDYARLVLSIVGNDYLNGEVIRIDGALRMAPK